MEENIQIFEGLGKKKDAEMQREIKESAAKDLERYKSEKFSTEKIEEEINKFLNKWSSRLDLGKLKFEYESQKKKALKEAEILTKKEESAKNLKELEKR